MDPDTSLRSSGPGRRYARLLAVTGLVPEGARLADVGTDRGVLPRLLLASGRIATCIASDVNAVALRAARLEATVAGHAGRLEFRHAAGLAAITTGDRIDTVTLCGLGGRSIVRILDCGRLDDLGVQRLVIQPQTEVARVRRWLGEHRFGLVAERMIRERRRYYVILAAERGADTDGQPPAPLRAGDLAEVGPYLARSGDPVVRSFWIDEARRLSRALSGAPPGSAREARLRLALSRRVLRALERARQASPRQRSDILTGRGNPSSLADPCPGCRCS